MRVTNATGYHDPRDALSHDWQCWLESRGHTVLPIPNLLKDVPSYLDDLRANAIVLSGGNDVEPTKNNFNDLSEIRTKTEFSLLDIAGKRGLPVLGSCRGLHVINLWSGGKITAEVENRPNAIRHVANNHMVEILAPFDSIADTSQAIVNSYHNQGVTRDQLGVAIYPFAISADGLVEGFVHERLPILAMQWHPERKNPASDLDDLLIEKFFGNGAFWATSLSA